MYSYHGYVVVKHLKLEIVVHHMTFTLFQSNVVSVRSEGKTSVRVESREVIMLHLSIPLCLSLANNECTLLKQLGMSLGLVYDTLYVFEKLTTALKK